MSRRAQAHAKRLLTVIPDDVRDELRVDPVAAIERMGYIVRFRDERDIGGRCTVAGSFDAGPPPTFNVVRSNSVGRRFFTALHELGHRLVAEDPTLQDEFDEEDDQGKRLEEDICDAIAAELLLPDEVVDVHIGARGPTARSVRALFRASNASREACCVRAAQRIFGSGYVMLVHDGVAQFTATQNSVYRIRRGTEQPDDHLVRRAQKRGSDQGRAQVRFASGNLSPLIYGDAVRDTDDYVFAVFVETNPAWIHGPAVAAPGDSYFGVEAYCPHCEVDFEAFRAPCPSCGGYVHGCGKCACGAAGITENRLCTSCFLRRPPAEFSAGGDTCDICLGR